MLHINKKYYKFKGEIYEFKANYSVPDFTEDQFNLQRSLPHQDNIFDDHNYRKGLALTLYLCQENPNYGGTIIYKLKNEKNKNKIREIREYGEEEKFDLKLTNEYFDVLHNAKLKFNKALIYPTFYWHNINIIPENYNHNKNRLTITAFLTFDTFENDNKNDFLMKNLIKLKYQNIIYKIILLI